MKGEGISKEDARARAAQWALNRHNRNKTSPLSTYQVRNLKKAATKQKLVNYKKISVEDLSKLKRITKEANSILKKYK